MKGLDSKLDFQKEVVATELCTSLRSSSLTVKCQVSESRDGMTNHFAYPCFLIDLFLILTVLIWLIAWCGF